MLLKNKARAKHSEKFCIENGFMPCSLLNSYSRRQFKRNKNVIISKFNLKPLPLLKNESNYKQPKDMNNFVLKEEKETLKC